jgi:hypothetical protein
MRPCLGSRQKYGIPRFRAKFYNQKNVCLVQAMR